MKINNLDIALAMNKDDIKKNKNQDQVTDQFQNLLNELGTNKTNNLDNLSKNLNKLENSSLNSPSLVEQIFASQQIQGLNLEAISFQINNTLNLLDEFASALADPAKSLKNIAPLAEQLEIEAAKLVNNNQIINNNHDLKNIAQKTAILATVESMKFKRGDYL